MFTARRHTSRIGISHNERGSRLLPFLRQTRSPLLITAVIVMLVLAVCVYSTRYCYLGLCDDRKISNPMPDVRVVIEPSTTESADRTKTEPRRSEAPWAVRVQPAEPNPNPPPPKAASKKTAKKAVMASKKEPSANVWPEPDVVRDRSQDPPGSMALGMPQPPMAP